LGMDAIHFAEAAASHEPTHHGQTKDAEYF
jgi:hypothetical protein